jgi:hypothetical protein
MSNPLYASLLQYLGFANSGVGVATIVSKNATSPNVHVFGSLGFTITSCGWMHMCLDRFRITTHVLDRLAMTTSLKLIPTEFRRIPMGSRASIDCYQITAITCFSLFQPNSGFRYHPTSCRLPNDQQRQLYTESFSNDPLLATTGLLSSMIMRVWCASPAG